MVRSLPLGALLAGWLPPGHSRLTCCAHHQVCPHGTSPGTRLIAVVSFPARYKSSTTTCGCWVIAVQVACVHVCCSSSQQAQALSLHENWQATMLTMPCMLRELMQPPANPCTSLRDSCSNTGVWRANRPTS